MTVPFRLRLGRAVTDTLKTITPANGFTHNMADFDPGDGSPTAARVFRGRAWFGDQDPMPMLSVLENPNPADELVAPVVDSTTGAYDWNLLIQGFVADDPQSPTDPAYLLEQEVRIVLGREKRRTKPGSHITDPFGASTWNIPGCGVYDMTISPGVIRPADDVSANAYFWLPVRLRIVEALEGA